MSSNASGVVSEKGSVCAAQSFYIPITMPSTVPPEELILPWIESKIRLYNEVCEILKKIQKQNASMTQKLAQHPEIREAIVGYSPTAESRRRSAGMRRSWAIRKSREESPDETEGRE